MRPDLYVPGSTYHRNRRWTHAYTVRCLEAAIEDFGRPSSLLDVGCAEGVLVQWANAHGIEAMGVDLAAGDAPALLRADLQMPVDLQRTFEWVLCWEVAEHLPKAAAETLVETIVRHMHPQGRVLFTAAPPGQPGPGHIHCAPAAYWHGLFAAHGLTRAEEMTVRLQERWLTCSPKTPWYGRNISVYWRVA